MLLEYDAKTEELHSSIIIKFSNSVVEMLLPYTSDRQKGRMLLLIAQRDLGETDHGIEIAKLLLKAGADSEFCDETQHTSALSWVRGNTVGKLTKLFAEHKKNATNNNSHSSGRRWTIIVPAVLFSAIGATLAAMGIIPEIGCYWSNCNCCVVRNRWCYSRGRGGVSC